MSIIKGSGPCAGCGITERETQSYCRPCSNKRRNFNQRPKYPCSLCGINPKELGPGKRYCKDCTNLPKRRHDPKVWQQTQRKYKYGLNEETVIAILSNQNSACSICLTEITIDTLHLDHDHGCCKGAKTCGKCLRGFLCSYCNHGIGRFKDNTDLLLRACEYLKNPPAREWRI